MSTIVFLANQQIQIVSGTKGKNKIKVDWTKVTYAPDGCIINGTVIDRELFVSYMKDYFKANNVALNDVYLVINSNKMITKNVDAPKVNDKKLKEFIAREYADLESEDELIYAYISRGAGEAKGTTKYYAEGVSVDFIENYVSMFEEIGVKLKGIYSGEGTIISLAAMTCATKNKTFVFQLAENTTLTTVLWVNGSFYYYNYTRCFNEPGTIEYAEDIVRSVGQLRQFMKANQVEQELEKVVLAGIEPGDLNMYQNVFMQQGINTPVQIFGGYSNIVVGGSTDIQRALHAVSGLIDYAKGSDFLDDYLASAKKKNSKVDSTFTRNVFICSGVFGVMLIATLTCLFINLAARRELQTLKDYNESPLVMMETARYDKLVDRNTFLTGQYNSIQNIVENIDTYPYSSKEIESVILNTAVGYADIEFNSFSAETGKVSLTAKAADVDTINQFINKLSTKEIFESVQYTGYSYDQTEELWNINMTCTLAEAAGR